MGCILQCPDGTNSGGREDEGASSAPIKCREKRRDWPAIRSPDYKIRSILSDWSIRCNVRWKSLLPRRESQLANLRRIANDARERQRERERKPGRAGRFGARSRADKRVSAFGRCAATPSYDCNYARGLIYLRRSRFQYRSFGTQITFCRHCAPTDSEALIEFPDCETPRSLRLLSFNYYPPSSMCSYRVLDIVENFGKFDNLRDTRLTM